MTVLQTCSIVGIAIGSVFGGDFVKNGRRSTIIQFNIVGIIATLMTLQLASFDLMCLGRVLYGISCGVLACTTPKILDETIPSKLIDQGFGTSTSIIMNVGFLVVNMVAKMGPTDNLATSNFWMVIFGLQIPVQLVVLFLHGFVFTEDTLEFLVKKGDKK